MSLQVCFRASGRMLDLLSLNRSELIWANYKPKYLSGFNGPLNPIINITLHLGLGRQNNFRGKENFSLSQI